MNILELAILKKMVGGGGGSGTDNYNDLSNLPQINGETLAGNKTAENLGLQDALTFDSAPTEDSTNPVESGGVYNALAGKQDNLTFDDDPTENSANPVKSGGVYNALAGKQDNLTFDGVYNASTNKAATESTVTNAIAGLDVSAFSVDADETISSISETDGKINVTKQDIAIASNQVTAMTGYTKPSSAPATPAIQASDTANQAFGKLEFKADTNQTNIWYALETGANNLCPESQLTIVGNSRTKSLTVNLPAGKYYISCNATLTGSILADGVFKNSAGTAIGTASGFANGANAKSITIADTATEFYFYTTDANASFDNLMIVPEVVWNALDHNFRTAAISNADLTKLEVEDRAGLIECVDKGAKNVFKTFEASEITTVPATIAGLTFIRNADNSITLNGTNSTGSDVFIKIGVFNYEAGKEYVMGYSCIKDNNVNKAYAYSSDDYLASSYDPVRTHTYSSSGSAYVYIRVASDYQFVNDTIYPMICTKAKYDISPAYEPYALPNADLTRLEAEDRAALSEVVDSRAKNKASTDSFIINTSGGYVTNLKADLVDGEQYVVSFKTTAPDSSTLLIGFKNGSGTAILDIYVDINNGAGVAIFTCPSGFSYYNVQSYSGVGTYSDFMICTVADWKISQKVVPYRPDYDDVVEHTPHLLMVDASTTDTEAVISAVTIAIPASTIMRITARLGYNATAPKSITLSFSDDPNLYKTPRYLIASEERNPGETWQDVQACRAVSGGNQPASVYVWASSMASGSNKLAIITELLGTL